MKIINCGNWARSGVNYPSKPAPLELTEDTEIRGGNFGFANIVTNGYKLSWTGTANKRGCKIDGVLIDNAVCREYDVNKKAEYLRGILLKNGGQEALEAFEWVLQKVNNNPNISLAAIQADWAAFANAPKGTDGLTNHLDISRFFSRLVSCLSVSGATITEQWTNFKTMVLLKTIGVWLGEELEVIAEYS